MFDVVPLTPELEMTKSNLANLFYASVAFALNLDIDKLPSIHGNGDDLRYPNGTGGTCRIGTFRIKVMNYLNFFPLRIENSRRGSILVEERRTCRWYTNMLKESTHLKGGYGMDIIVYPNIAGSRPGGRTL